MLLGKIGQATKYINSEDSTLGVHPLSDEIKQILQDKHPESRKAEAEILLPDVPDEPQPVIFEGINAEKV